MSQARSSTNFEVSAPGPFEQAYQRRDANYKVRATWQAYQCRNANYKVRATCYLYSDRKAALRIRVC